MRRDRGEGRAPLRDERGMTLVELMVVVAVIAVIAAIAITLFQDVQRKARLAADQGTTSTMRSAVAIYYGKHNGGFPPDRAAVNALSVSRPIWQCSANVPPEYDSTNGKINLIVTLGDC